MSRPPIDLDMPIRVTTRNTHRRDVVPIQVTLGDITFEILRIDSTWIESGLDRGSPQFRIYQVVLEGERRLTLEHEFGRDLWRRRP